MSDIQGGPVYPPALVRGDRREPLPGIPGRNVDPPALVHGEASQDCSGVETGRYLI